MVLCTQELQISFPGIHTQLGFKQLEKGGSVSHRIKGWLWQGDHRRRDVCVCVCAYGKGNASIRGKVAMTKRLRQDRGVVPAVISILHNN